MKSHLLLPLVLLGAPLAGQQQADVKTPAPILPPKRAQAGMPAGPTLAATQTRELKPLATGAATRSRMPEDTVSVDCPGDGRIWARGRGYKASFDGAGATFIPFLGSDAPRNYPVSFALRGVRVGSENVDFKADGTATVSGRRVSIERGSLVETYDLAAKSMEQSFVFKTLPAGGDLVVEIAVTTELAQRMAGDGLRFANDLGEVGYDQAFVIDRNGQRERMQVTFDDGAIRLRASAAFLATAAQPITVDPVVTTFSVRGSTVSEFGSDIAYDLSQSQYLIVWEEAFSAADHDIACARHDRDGNQIFASAVYIDQTSINWSHPRVANLRAPRRFLVVGEYGIAPNREIWGRTREAGSAFLSTQFAISVAAGSGDKLNPDVGGDASDTGPAYWTVVWERTYSATDSDIHAQQIDEFGGRHFGLIPIANSVNTHETHPAISKSDGSGPRATQDWTVVWQYTYAPGDEDLWFARIHWDGTLTTPATVLEFNASNLTNPSVSSPTDDVNGHRRWMACCEAPISPTNRDIVGYVYEGVQQIASANLSGKDSQQQSILDQVMPQVDTDGSRFTVAWVEPYAIQSPDQDVLCSTYHVVYGHGIGVTEARIPVGASNDAEQRPRIAATHGAGALDHRYGITWDRQYSANDLDVEGSVYEGMGLGGFTNLPTGCAGLGMATSGGTALGDTASFQMTGVGANAPVMMFSLPQTPALAVCPGCSLGVRLGPASFFGGSSLSLRIPAEGAFVGGVLGVQGFTYGLGPCLGSVTLSDTALFRIR